MSFPCHTCRYMQSNCHGACLCAANGRSIDLNWKTRLCPHPKGPRFDKDTQPDGPGVLPDPDDRKAVCDWFDAHAGNIGSLATLFTFVTGKTCLCRQKRGPMIGLWREAECPREWAAIDDSRDA